MLPVWVCLLVSGLLTFIYRIVTKESRRKKKENQIGFFELVEADVDENFYLTLGKKRYFKKNRKRIKKGLSPLCQEDFLNEELKKCNRLDKKPYFWKIILPFATACITTLGMYIANQFPTRLDMIVYFVLVLLAEAFVLRWFWGCIQNTTLAEIAWIEQELANPTVWEDSSQTGGTTNG